MVTVLVVFASSFKTIFTLEFRGEVYRAAKTKLLTSGNSLEVARAPFQLNSFSLAFLA